MNIVVTEKEKGTTENFGNVFDNLSTIANGINTTDRDDGVPDFDNNRCRKRPMTDMCCSGTCVSFKDLEKRLRLSTECKDKGDKIFQDVIIISSDDDDSDDDDNEELDATSCNEMKGYFEKNIFSVIEENANNVCSSIKLEKDGITSQNQATIDSYFSPRKKEIEKRSPIRKKEPAVSVQNEQEKLKNGRGFSLEDSPIARSFFSKRRFKDNCDWQERVGSSAPLLAQNKNQRRASSLKPRDFSTCQTDFIDGLADDSMFYNVYLDTVLSFASKSIAPSGHIVMRIFSKIAQCSEMTTTLKAVNCLNRLLSMKVLTHQNFNLTWDLMVELASNCLREIEANLTSCSSSSACRCQTDTSNSTLHNENLNNKFSRLFLFLVSFLEEDFKRYSDSIRCCIFRKILSPCLHGFSRLRKVGDWLVKLLQILENAEDVHNNNLFSVTPDSSSLRGNIDQCGAAEGNFCTEKIASGEKLRTVCCQKIALQNKDEEPAGDSVEVFGKRIVQALQRLFHLSFLLNRDAKDESRVIAELFLNCFLEIRTLRWRKILLSSIEPSLVQQTTAELILSTIYDDTTKSAEYQNSPRLSLEIIVYGYFYKEIPYGNSSQVRDENIELFTYLLWMFVRAYLTLKNSEACQAMASLSVLSEQFNETTTDCGDELMSLSDRQMMLYIQEEVDLVRGRLLRYRGSEKLNINSELSLNLLKVVLDNCSKTISDF